MDRIRLGSLWTIAGALALASALLSISSMAQAQTCSISQLAAGQSLATVNINWTAPISCADGSTDMSRCTLTKYTVYSGPTASSKTVLGSAAPNVLTFAAAGTPPGAYHIDVTASSSAGESVHSGDICVTVLAPVLAPGAPGTPTITVSASNTTAFTLVKQRDAQLMLAVGTVAAGTGCIADEGVLSHGVFYNAVPKVSVKLSGTVSPDIVYAACGS